MEKELLINGSKLRQGSINNSKDNVKNVLEEERSFLLNAMFVKVKRF